MPERIQLRRTRGWRKPPDAIVVSRPSRWGNPYEIGAGQITYTGPALGEAGWYDPGRVVWADVPIHDGLTHAEAVQLYRDEMTATLAVADDDEPDAVARRDELRAALAELRGHDLACWCRPLEPCHGDVLLDLANAEDTYG